MWYASKEYHYIYQSLKRDMEDAYALSLENELRPLISNYTRDTGFCSFGVYAKKSFKKGDFIPGLVGFLAPIKENEAIDGNNDVSVIRHHTGSNVMLGGVFLSIRAAAKMLPMLQTQSKHK